MSFKYTGLELIGSSSSYSEKTALATKESIFALKKEETLLIFCATTSDDANKQSVKNIIFRIVVLFVMPINPKIGSSRKSSNFTSYIKIII